MTSILKVDQIQLANGNTATLDNLGITGGGKILQVQNTTFGTQTNYVGTQSYTPCAGSDCPITSTATNSKFLILLTADMYCTVAQGSNLSAGVKVGTGSYSRIRTGNDAWAAFGNGFGGSSSFHITKQDLYAPNYAAGTSLSFNMYLGCWNTTMTSNYVNYSGYGILSSVTVFEIAP